MKNKDTDTEIKKVIDCSFCGKNRSEVKQMIEGPSLSQQTLYICNECVDMTYEILHREGPLTVKKKDKILTPSQVKDHLDKFIIGQDSAKVAISVAFYNHFKRLNSKSSVNIDKSNLLMIGESGCGKTLTVKTVSKLFNLPCVIIDATSLTEAGYVGKDVATILGDLLVAADGDLEKAQTGVVFIDEIDKKSRKLESSTVTRDVSGEGVQQALLKIIEGSIVEIEDEETESKILFDTTNVLFISSGAFVGLEDIIRNDRNKSKIGIGADLKGQNTLSNSLKQVRPDDLVKYGLIPEFVGRHPITVVFDNVTTEMLVDILQTPKDNIVSQFKALFDFEGVTLTFDDKYLLNVAKECIVQKIGARGLRSILEKDLQTTQFDLPNLVKQGVNKVFIGEKGIVKHGYKAKRRAINGK